MKSIPLRQLLREPTKVKRITGAGRSVQITDNGRPLWIVQPAIAGRNDPERARAIDALLDEVLCETVSSVSLSKMVKDGRR
jgi:hypothetical protein